MPPVDNRHRSGQAVTMPNCDWANMTLNQICNSMYSALYTPNSMAKDLYKARDEFCQLADELARVQQMIRLHETKNGGKDQALAITEATLAQVQDELIKSNNALRIVTSEKIALELKLENEGRGPYAYPTAEDLLKEDLVQAKVELAESEAVRQAQTDKLCLLKAKLQTKDSELVKVQALAKKKDHELLDFKAECKATHISLQVMDEIQRPIQLNMEDKDRRIVADGTELSKAQKLITLKNEELFHVKTQLSKAQKLITLKDEELVHVKTQLSKAQKLITLKDEELVHVRTQLNTQTCELADAQDVLNVIEETVSNLEAQLAGKDEQILEAKITMVSKAEELSKSMVLIKTKDCEVSRLTAIIEAKDYKFSQAIAHIDAKNIQISQLKRDCENKHITLTKMDRKLQATLGQHSSQIMKVASDVGKMVKHYEALQAQVVVLMKNDKKTDNAMSTMEKEALSAKENAAQSGITQNIKDETVVETMADKNDGIGAMAKGNENPDDSKVMKSQQGAEAHHHVGEQHEVQSQNSVDEQKDVEHQEHLQDMKNDASVENLDEKDGVKKVEHEEDAQTTENAQNGVDVHGQNNPANNGMHTTEDQIIIEKFEFDGSWDLEKTEKASDTGCHDNDSVQDMDDTESVHTDEPIQAITDMVQDMFLYSGPAVFDGDSNLTSETGTLDSNSDGSGILTPDKMSIGDEEWEVLASSSDH